VLPDPVRSPALSENRPRRRPRGPPPYPTRSSASIAGAAMPGRVATGISAIMNCSTRHCSPDAREPRKSARPDRNSPSGWQVWSRWSPVHCPGETTRTPSDMPFLPIPCTQPEPWSTDTPSWKWQIQSYACGDEASRSSWIRAYRLRASTATPVPAGNAQRRREEAGTLGGRDGIVAGAGGVTSGLDTRVKNQGLFQLESEARCRRAGPGRRPAGHCGRRSGSPCTCTRCLAPAS